MTAEQTVQRLTQQRDELMRDLERMANKSLGWDVEEFRRFAKAALNRKAGYEQAR